MAAARTVRAIGPLVFAVVLAGCVPGPAMRAARPAGPGLVVTISNLDGAERAVGYSFSADGAAGVGESLVAACTRSTLLWGEVSGRFEITVDGATAFESDVPAQLPTDGYLVVRVLLGPDQGVNVDPDVEWTDREPVIGDVALAGCS